MTGSHSESWPEELETIGTQLLSQLNEDVTSSLVRDDAGDIGPAVQIISRLAQRELAMRQYRKDRLEKIVLGGTGWELLLETYLAAAEGRPLGVRDTCEKIGISLSTGLRYLASLKKNGLIRAIGNKESFPSDGLTITAKGGKEVVAYFGFRLAMGIL